MDKTRSIVLYSLLIAAVILIFTNSAIASGSPSFNPTLNQSSNSTTVCYQISNFSQGSQQTVGINNQSFNIYESNIGVGYASVSVNNTYYSLPLGSIVNITRISNDTYYITLLNISNAQKIPTISFAVCSKEVKNLVFNQATTIPSTYQSTIPATTTIAQNPYELNHINIELVALLLMALVIAFYLFQTSGRWAKSSKIKRSRTKRKSAK